MITLTWTCSLPYPSCSQQTTKLISFNSSGLIISTLADLEDTGLVAIFWYVATWELSGIFF